MIELRKVRMDEARTEIIDLFATGETLYYSDMSERLRTDFDMFVYICRELQQEGAIGRVDIA